MKILFTGASSFTGFHFVNALIVAGHEVICPLRRPVEGYEGLRRERVEILERRVAVSSACGKLPTASFGSDDFLKIIQEFGPFDLLCHHAADVTNYKSPDFDAVRALENNTANLGNLLETFKSCGGKAVLLTGTVFEMDEGKGDGPLHAFSPYGLSKGLTWEIFCHFCRSARLPLGKFVIPNPFGPWEEPRFTAYLMNTWRKGETAKVQTPDYVRDNIHADLLSGAYAVFATRVAAHKGEPIKLNPSGYVETQGAFAERVAREVRARTPWKCGLDLLVQTEFPEPRIRTNIESARELVPHWNESAAWDAFVGFYTAAAA